VLAWGRTTADELRRLEADPTAGVHTTTLLELFAEPAPDPWWKDSITGFCRLAPEELPPGYHDGYRVDVPVIETPVYMRYLLERFRTLGGTVEERSVDGLSDRFREARVVVNCAGLGARELVGDDDLFPIRGQVVRVRAPQVRRCVVDDYGPNAIAYVIPRSADCILGGTADEGDWNLTPDPETALAILRRCSRMVPALEHAEVLEHRVGLRPGRREVRLELERVGEGSAVIHNYGHGGAGFTLSWGCADEVAALAEEALGDR
jgi:D-amino-acid oxidase